MQASMKQTVSKCANKWQTSTYLIDESFPCHLHNLWVRLEILAFEFLLNCHCISILAAIAIVVRVLNQAVFTGLRGWRRVGEETKDSGLMLLGLCLVVTPFINDRQGIGSFTLSSAIVKDVKCSLHTMLWLSLMICHQSLHDW
jgi:hypothetical protein